MDENPNDDNKQIVEEENDEDCKSEEYEEDPTPDPTVLEWSSFVMKQILNGLVQKGGSAWK